MSKPSWHTSYGESPRLMFALYVRDVAGLAPRVNPQLPPLIPRLAVRSDLAEPSDIDLISRQWATWWQDIFAPVPTVEQRRLPEPRHDLLELDDRPQLQRVARTVYSDGQSWIAESKTRLAPILDLRDDQSWRVEFDLVKIAQGERRGLKRMSRVKPFDLKVSGLPVDTKQGWHITKYHVLVTRGLREDVVAYRKWLLPIVKELV